MNNEYTLTEVIKLASIGEQVLLNELNKQDTKQLKKTAGIKEFLKTIINASDSEKLTLNKKFLAAARKAQQAKKEVAGINKLPEELINPKHPMYGKLNKLLAKRIALNENPAKLEVFAQANQLNAPLGKYIDGTDYAKLLARNIKDAAKGKSLNLDL